MIQYWSEFIQRFSRIDVFMFLQICVTAGTALQGCLVILIKMTQSVHHFDLIRLNSVQRLMIYWHFGKVELVNRKWVTKT